MKRVFLSALALFGLMTAGFSQSDYKSAIGGRLSSSYYEAISGSFKTFISDQGALEFNLGFRGHKSGEYDWATVALSAAYQHHFEIKPVPGLRWFVGGGLTAYNSFSDHDDFNGFGLGIFPTGGIDYKFENIPLNLSADIRPTVSLVDPYHDDYDGFKSFNGGNFGVAVRYTF